MEKDNKALSAVRTDKAVFKKMALNKTFLAFLFLCILSGLIFRDKHFLSLENAMNILLKASKNGGLLALGMTFVILSGEIDLSVGAVFALSGVVMGLVGEVNPFLGIFAGIMVGVLTGAMISFLVCKMRISSWIASLSMLFALRGMVQILAKKSVAIKEPVLLFAKAKLFSNLIPGVTGGISVLIVFFFAFFFLCRYLAENTKFGMRLYASGGNEEAAKLMGIQVKKIKSIAFFLSGFIAALSGVFLASSSGSATLSAGNLYETYAIAMCAIGGIQLSGGQGKFSGTFFGILIYYIINTLFTYLPSSISVHWQSIIMGILVILSVAMQSEIFHQKK